MYSATSEKTHYLSRTGSHATKGSARGTVWWCPSKPPRGLNDLEQAAFSVGIKAMRKLIIIHASARKHERRYAVKECEVQMHALEKNLRRIQKEALARNA